MLELIQLSPEHLQLYSSPTNLVEDIPRMEMQQKWSECHQAITPSTGAALVDSPSSDTSSKVVSTSSRVASVEKQ